MLILFSDIPTFGEIENPPIQLLDTAGTSFKDFLNLEEESKNPEPLTIKVSWFSVPTTTGSEVSISLFKAHLELKTLSHLKLNSLDPSLDANGIS
jgi:hypothetical protein